MPYLLFLKKRQNLQLSSAANYRWVRLCQCFSYQVGNFSIACNMLLQELGDVVRKLVFEEADQRHAYLQKTRHNVEIIY